MKKSLYSLLLLPLLFTGCIESKVFVVENKAKPLIFFNRQPSNPVTGSVDMTTLKWNDTTYYVGFDAENGGDVQGELVKNWLTQQSEALDKNGDGIISYVLCIGDTNHNDSNARTEGIRRALGTYNYTTEPGRTKKGKMTIGATEFVIQEIASKVMVDENGKTWNSEVAKATMEEWINEYGDQIDFVVSNNDGMAMGCLAAPNYPQGLAIFGYDANYDAVEAIGQGKLTGTVSQNTDAQAVATLQLLRNVLDGVYIENAYIKGFSEPDRYGNIIGAKIKYEPTQRSLLALNTIVNSYNWKKFREGTREAKVNQINAKKKNVLLTIYDKNNDFLKGSFIPALEYYAPLLNINLTIIKGDGSNEDSVLNNFTELYKYDGFAVNMVKTNSGKQYTDCLRY